MCRSDAALERPMAVGVGERNLRDIEEVCASKSVSKLRTTKYDSSKLVKITHELGRRKCRGLSC